MIVHSAAHLHDTVLVLMAKQHRSIQLSVCIPV